MLGGANRRDELKVPAGTTVAEHDIVTDGDVVIGARSSVELGIRGRRVVAGEGVSIAGDVEAEGDCRLDMWCETGGNVLVGGDAFLGERVTVGGELKVAGDLDVGDDVEVEDGLEANGWIEIRTPMPTVVFLVVYLRQLLLIGEDDAAERLLGAASEADGPGAEPLVIPRSATVSDDAWRVSTPATVGEDCRLHGNLRARSIEVGAACDVFGSLRARGDVTVGRGTRVHGDVTTREGAVAIAPDAEVLGDVACGDLELGDGATVDGAMRARGELRLAHARPSEVE